MLFCPSFTQSERFLQTDQLITRLQVVVITNIIRMLMRNVIVNVSKSDAVIWWAAIFRRRRGVCVEGGEEGKEEGSGRILLGWYSTSLPHVPWRSGCLLGCQQC